MTKQRGMPAAAVTSTAAACGIFKLLSDESRLKILVLLLQHGPSDVSTLCDILAQSQPAVSHHLAILRMVGAVEATPIGKRRVYSLESEPLRDILRNFFSGGKHE